MEACNPTIASRMVCPDWYPVSSASALGFQHMWRYERWNSIGLRRSPPAHPPKTGLEVPSLSGREQVGMSTLITSIPKPARATQELLPLVYPWDTQRSKST